MKAATGSLRQAATRWLVGLALAMSGTGTAAAQEVALTLAPGRAAEPIELTLDELAALPQTTIVTENEFSDGPVSYTGPLVRHVLDLAEIAEVELVRFTAANDYFVDIPTRDFHTYDVILAMEADGTRLSRRDKGPLWLMYPISDHSELRDPDYIHRLIWQVVRIEPQ